MDRNDIETDADQSNPGDGSHLQSFQPPDDPPVAASEVSFESIIANLQHLQLQTKERMTMLQKAHEELAQKYKKAIEEKDIWMTRCQRMESQLSVAAGSDELTDQPDSGEKQLENFLQENAFLKAECDKLRYQLTQAEAACGIRAGSGRDCTDGGVVPDSQHDEDESRRATQPTGDDTNPEQHGTTLDAAPIKSIPHGAGQSAQVGGPHHPDQQQVSYGAHGSQSLSGRRGVHVQLPGPVYQPGQVQEERRLDPALEDAGDKAPDDDMLQSLAQNLRHDQYRGILRKAGLDDNKIADVAYGHQTDATECRFQTLKEWRFKLGRRATLRKLVHVMIGAGIRATTEEFCHQYNLYHLVLEYDQMYPESAGDDEPDTPITPGYPGGDAPQPQPERKLEPLERIIGSLMNHPEKYEEDFVMLLEEDQQQLTEQQVKDFMKDQKWKNVSKHFFEQNLKDVLKGVSTMHNVLESWALVVLSLFDSNPRYRKLDKRQHVWKMMKYLRKSHNQLFRRFAQDEIFPGGVVGLDPQIAGKMVNQLNFNHHNKMKLLLQQTRDDGNDWRALAAKIPNVTQVIINNWTQKGHDVAAENTLKTYGTSNKGTVQNLYEALIEIERCDVAQVLEE